MAVKLQMAHTYWPLARSRLMEDSMLAWRACSRSGDREEAGGQDGTKEQELEIGPTNKIRNRKSRGLNDTRCVVSYQDLFRIRSMSSFHRNDNISTHFD